jgi:hypothetical protein
MTAAIHTPVLFPKSPAQEAKLGDLEFPPGTGNFACLMDQAGGAGGGKNRQAAARTPAEATVSEADKDSEADEASKPEVTLEDPNAPAAPPPAWLANLSAAMCTEPIPDPLTGTVGQQNTADRSSLAQVPAGDGFLPRAQSKPNSTQPGNSWLCSAFSAPSDPRDSISNSTQPESAEAQDSSAPVAMPSDAKPPVAGSPQAPAMAKPTAQETGLMTEVSDRGRSAAQHNGTMQTLRETDENACLAEQNLPSLPAALEAAEPAGRERKIHADAVDHLIGLPGGAADSALALPEHATHRELGADADADATQTTMAEGVRRVIESAAVTLRRMDAGSLSLVLTPDGNTQLALHVKLQQGQFEVQAVLERGSFAALGAEWSQLQTRLAEQGVRLAPLTSGAEIGNGFSGEPQFSQKHGREETPSGESLIPALTQTVARKSGARTVAATNGRAWWA